MKAYFVEKIEKYFKMSSAEFARRVVKVKVTDITRLKTWS